MGKTRDVELKVGRRSADGIVRLAAYPPQLVQLSADQKILFYPTRTNRER